MSLATATITYDISDMVGADFDPRRTKVWVTTNVEGDAVIDTDGAQIRLGDGLGSLSEDGTGSVQVWVPGDGSNPASWQTYIHVDHSDRRPAGVGGKREVRTFGPFTITEDTDLAYLVAEQEVPPTYLSQVTAELQTYVDEAEAARDEAAAITGLTGEDEAVALLVGDDGSETRAAIEAQNAEQAALQAKTLARFRDFIRSAGVTASTPLVPIGDSHTDDTTASQFLWNRLQDVRNRTGEGLEGVASAAIVPMGKNGQTLAAYRAAPAQTGGFNAAMALNPSATLSCWLTNDVRSGALGLTVAAIRAAGSALLNAHVADIKANANRPDFILLRIPAPYTTQNSGGLNYISDGAGNINPAGLAQIYTDGVRAAYYDVLTTNPDVLIYDPQTRVFGTTSPTSNDVTNGLYADQIHQTQRGYEVEGDDFAEWVAAAQPRKEGAAFEARRTTPSTPWTAYSREIEDPTRYALVAEGAITEDGVDTRTFIRFGPSVPAAIPGNIRTDDIMEFVASGKSAVIPSGSTISANGANTQISFGGGATLASIGVGAVTYLPLYRISRRPRGPDDTVNRVAADKSYSFRRLGRVTGGATSYVDIGSASFSTEPPPLTAGDWVPTINAGDLLYVEGVAAPITLTGGGGTGAYAANGPTLRVSNLSGLSLDFSTMVGKMIAIVGTHRDIGAGTLTNTVAASSTAQTLLDTAAGYGLNVITLTANCTLSLPKAVVGKTLEVVLIQDATGSRTVTWPSSFPAVRWPSATTPTLTTTAAKADWFRLRCYDGVNWLGEVVGQNYTP